MKGRQLLRLAACLFVWCMVSACAARPPYVWYSSLPASEKTTARTTISPGDQILVQVAQHPELTGEFTIGMSGEYSHGNVGLIRVAGADVEKAASIIKVKLARIVQDPQVSVTLLAYRQIAVTIVGEVENPGTYQLAHGSGVLAGLGAAGGLNDFASQDSIYVLRVKQGGQRIRFRYTDLVRPDPAAYNFELTEGDAVVVE